MLAVAWWKSFEFIQAGAVVFVAGDLEKGCRCLQDEHRATLED